MVSMWVVALGVVATLIVARRLMRVAMADIYDIIIIKMTKTWYACVLDRLGCVHSPALQGRD